MIASQQKNAKYRRISWELLWIILGQAIGAVGSLVGVRILTGRLSPDSYGQLALGMTIVTIVQQVLTGPLGQATLRQYAPSVDAGDLPLFFTTVRHLQANVTIAAIAVGLPAAIYVGATLNRTYFALILLALGISIVSGANGSLDSVQTAARHRSVVALHQAATQWARPLAAWLLFGVIGASGASALTGYLMASCAVLISQLWQFQRHFPGELLENSVRDLDYAREFLAYAWPFSAWGLFTALQLVSDRWVLSLSLDNRSVGIYAAASQLGFAPIMMLSTASSVFICPVLFSRAGDGSDPVRVNDALWLNRRLVWLTAVGSSLVAFATYLLRDTLVRLLCGARYGEVSKYLPWLVVAAGLFACGQVSTHALLIYRHTKALIVPKITTGVLALLLYLAGARVAGVYGVVAANIGWTLVYYLWVTLIASRIASRTRMAIASTLVD